MNKNKRLIHRIKGYLFLIFINKIFNNKKIIKNHKFFQIKVYLIIIKKIINKIKTKKNNNKK